MIRPVRLKGRKNPRTITNITERVSECLLYCARFRSCKTGKRLRETEPVAVARCNEDTCIRYQVPFWSGWQVQEIYFINPNGGAWNISERTSDKVHTAINEKCKCIQQKERNNNAVVIVQSLTTTRWLYFFFLSLYLYSHSYNEVGWGWGRGMRRGRGCCILTSSLSCFPFPVASNWMKSGTQKKGWNFFDDLFISFFGDLIKTTGAKTKKQNLQRILLRK